MTKDYITITKSDGSTEQMEVVAIFKLVATSKDCIIYRSLQENKFYAAQFDRNSDYSILNTDFTLEEKEQLNKIFETLNKGGKNNA